MIKCKHNADDCRINLCFYKQWWYKAELFFSLKFLTLFSLMSVFVWAQVFLINYTHFKTKSPDHKRLFLNLTIIITHNNTFLFISFGVIWNVFFKRKTTILWWVVKSTARHTLILVQSLHRLKVQRQSKHVQTPNAMKADRLHWGHLSYPTAAVTATSDWGFVGATQLLFSILLSLDLGHSPPLKWGGMQTCFVMRGVRQVTRYMNMKSSGISYRVLQKRTGSTPPLFIQCF